MGSDRISGDNFTHKFPHQFDTSESKEPAYGKERKITQEISDETDTYHRLSGKRLQIPCGFEHFRGDPKHFGGLHRKISGQIAKNPMVKIHLSNHIAEFSHYLIAVKRTTGEVRF